mgnify:CR=1 FL=1
MVNYTFIILLNLIINITYTQIHKKIEKSPLLFTDEYQQKVIDSLGYSLVETFNDIKKNLKLQAH